MISFNNNFSSQPVRYQLSDDSSGSLGFENHYLKAPSDYLAGMELSEQEVSSEGEDLNGIQNLNDDNALFDDDVPADESESKPLISKTIKKIIDKGAALLLNTENAPGPQTALVDDLPTPSFTATNITNKSTEILPFADSDYLEVSSELIDDVEPQVNTNQQSSESEPAVILPFADSDIEAFSSEAELALPEAEALEIPASPLKISLPQSGVDTFVESPTRKRTTREADENSTLISKSLLNEARSVYGLSQMLRNKVVRLSGITAETITIVTEKDYDNTLYCSLVGGKKSPSTPREYKTHNAFKSTFWRQEAAPIFRPIKLKTKQSDGITTRTFQLPTEFLSHERVKNLASENPDELLLLIADIFDASLKEYLKGNDPESVGLRVLGKDRIPHVVTPISDILKAKLNETIENWDQNSSASTSGDETPPLSCSLQNSPKNTFASIFDDSDYSEVSSAEETPPPLGSLPQNSQKRQRTGGSGSDIPETFSLSDHLRPVSQEHQENTLLNVASVVASVSPGILPFADSDIGEFSSEDEPALIEAQAPETTASASVASSRKRSARELNESYNYITAALLKEARSVYGLSLMLRNKLPDLSGVKMKAVDKSALLNADRSMGVARLANITAETISIVKEKNYDNALYCSLVGRKEFPYTKQQENSHHVSKSKFWCQEAAPILRPILARGKKLGMRSFYLPSEFLTHERVKSLASENPNALLLLIADIFDASLKEYLKGNDPESVGLRVLGIYTIPHVVTPISDIIKAKLNETIAKWEASPARGAASLLDDSSFSEGSSGDETPPLSTSLQNSPKNASASILDDSDFSDDSLVNETPPPLGTEPQNSLKRHCAMRSSPDTQESFSLSDHLGPSSQETQKNTLLDAASVLSSISNAVFYHESSSSEYSTDSTVVKALVNISKTTFAQKPSSSNSTFLPLTGIYQASRHVYGLSYLLRNKLPLLDNMGLNKPDIDNLKLWEQSKSLTTISHVASDQITLQIHKLYDNTVYKFLNDSTRSIYDPKQLDVLQKNKFRYWSTAEVALLKPISNNNIDKNSSYLYRSFRFPERFLRHPTFKNLVQNNKQAALQIIGSIFEISLSKHLNGANPDSLKLTGNTRKPLPHSKATISEILEKEIDLTIAFWNGCSSGVASHTQDA